MLSSGGPRPCGWSRIVRKRDYESRPGHQKAMICIAMIAVMSRRLARI